MNRIFKLFFSMSLSGTLLILILFLGKPLYTNRTSRRWQYYIWLVVIARLLLPFSPQESISGMLVERIQPIVFQMILAQTSENAGSVEKEAGLTENEIILVEHEKGSTDREDEFAEDGNMLAGSKDDTVVQYREDAGYKSKIFNLLSSLGIKVVSHLWVIWIGVAALLLVRKVTIYQSFVNYIKAGREEISDIHLLDLLAQVGGQIGVKRPVELYVNKQVFSPMLLGFFRPCVVLPCAELPDADFWYTIWHELTHYKRFDLFYKWLVQVTICIHWFNPLVWWMGRELRRACELACDEAIICRLDGEGRQAYGDTLLHALKAGGSRKHSQPSVMLSESAKQLKERLCVIMNFNKSSKCTVWLSVFLTAVLMIGATTAGAAVPERLNSNRSSASTVSEEEQVNHLLTVSGKKSVSEKQAQKYYKAGDLAAFGKVFSRLEKDAQKTWLKKIYKEDEIAFFAVSLEQLDPDPGSALIDSFAKTAYQDGEISFFSVLADYMDDKTLKTWLERAKKDGRTKFQLTLLEALDMDGELQAVEKELENKRIAEYKKHGITVKGKSYYYKGKLVNIFLDIRKDSSFYTLDINPQGSVNVKVSRDADGKIKKVGRMSDAQAKELLGDWEEEKNYKKTKDKLDEALTKAGGVKVTIPVHLNQVKDGEYAWIGTYDLSLNDKVYYNVSAKNGERLDVGFARAGSKNPDVTYHTVSNRRTDEKLEVRSGPYVWKKPLKAGKYQLFVRTKGADLEKVDGAVVIVKA